MGKSKPATLVRLRDIDETFADRNEDIRGRHVYDTNHNPLGKIDALLLDTEEQKIRFIEVASGGFLGLGEQKSLIPVDAITKITESEVQISHSADVVAGAPMYDPELVNQSDLYESTYGYYGMTPYWSDNYTSPSYTGEDPLAGKWYR